MRKTLLSALTVAVLLGASSTAPAQAQASSGADTKPVLTVSISGFDAITRDLNLIGKATGAPEMTGMMLGMFEQQAGGVLKCIDKTKPWGLVVLTDEAGEEFPVYAFVPVTDLKQLLAEIQKLPEAPAIPQPDAEGVYEVPTPDGGRQVCIQQKGNWAVLANSRETLANVPADPTEALGGSHKTYALAIRVAVKNIPSGARQMALMYLQMGVAMGQQRQPGEGDEEYAFRKAMTARSMEELTRAINETDTLLIGLAVDPQSSAVRLDVEMTAVEGTSSAEEYALLGQSKSDLTGFFRPDAALTGLWAGALAEGDAAQLTSMIDTYGSKALDELDEQGLSDDEKKLAKQVLGDLMDVARATIKARRVDAGFALLADASRMYLVAGGFVADAAKLEKLAKQLVNLIAEEEPKVAKLVTFDAAEHQGVRLHTLSIPSDELGDYDMDDLPDMIAGEQFTVVVGFGDQNAYLAAGPGAVDALKKAIDQSKAAAGQSVAPFRLSASASAIGRIVEGVAEGEDLGPGAMVLEVLKQMGQNDHVTITVEAVPNGARSRIEIEEGILKLIGVAVQTAIAAPLGAPPIP